MRLPQSFAFEQGAMVEPLAVTVHAVKKVDSLEQKKVVVLGSGSIGNRVAQVISVRGASVWLTVTAIFEWTQLAGEGCRCFCILLRDALSAALQIVSGVTGTASPPSTWRLRAPFARQSTLPARVGPLS